jgi:hypothetical protein
MTEPKTRRQGQKKANGTISTPKQICPKCGEYLKTAWMLENRKYKRVGLCCPNPACDHIIKDLVELEDETEPINELEND